MPLVNFKVKYKISLNHKKNSYRKKAMIHNSDQEVPQSISFAGSLTIEAALLFPLILFVMLFFLSFFRMLQIQQMTEEALAAAGAKAALEADSAGGDDKKLEGMALLCFYQELNRQDCPFQYVWKGRTGFRFQGIQMAGETVDLVLQYKLVLPTGILNNKKISVRQRVKLKKWNGYHGAAKEESNDSWVFITPEGTVFHLARDCTYLQLSIHTVSPKQAVREKYTPCMICGGMENHGGSYYVTQEGERYHTRLTCSGLKRTVYMVRISEAGGRALCSRCGG